MERLPIAIIAGKGPAPEGYITFALSAIDLPEYDISTRIVLRLGIEAVNDLGFGGRDPSSYCCKSVLISSLRQRQCSVVVTREPFAKWNGLGSFGDEKELTLERTRQEAAARAIAGNPSKITPQRFEAINMAAKTHRATRVG